VKQRKSGSVLDQEDPVEAFYEVHFCFGKDGDREYLDFYFDERRAGPSHVRLYEDGEEKRLPTYHMAYSYAGDATEQDKAQAKAEWHEYNDNNSAMLKEKFGI